MKRAELVTPEAPLKLVSTSVPDAPPNGARLKTTYGGICHSDIHMKDDEREIAPGVFIRQSEIFQKLGKPYEGMVLGHEIAGIIEEFGSAAKPEDHGLKVGDLVVLYPWVGCGNCETCGAGHTSQCDQNPGMFFNYGCGPERHGGYSTHVSAHNLDILIKVPESIPKEMACMLPCSVLTAFSALKKARSFLEEGYKRNQHSKLLIAGAGGLGLWGIQIARNMYADLNIEITVADIAENKLEIAKSHGADFTVQWLTKFESREAYLAEVMKTTREGKYKFDAAIDFVGATNTFNMACRSLRVSGSLIVVGLFNGNLEGPLVELVLKMYHIQGHIVGNLSDLKECVDFVANNNIQYPPIEFVTLENASDTLERLRKGKVNGRALIKHSVV